MNRILIPVTNYLLFRWQFKNSVGMYVSLIYILISYNIIFRMGSQFNGHIAIEKVTPIER